VTIKLARLCLLCCLSSRELEEDGGSSFGIRQAEQKDPDENFDCFSPAGDCEVVTLDDKDLISLKHSRPRVDNPGQSVDFHHSGSGLG
jgi:hypothetical protein